MDDFDEVQFDETKQGAAVAQHTHNLPARFHKTCTKNNIVLIIFEKTKWYILIQIKISFKKKNHLT